MKPSEKKVPAGRFSKWLDAFRESQLTGSGMDVPCGDCASCCISSYFIHVGPGEQQTRKAIPRQLFFPAPGLPKGHQLLGVDEKGHCPMYREDGCKIYSVRPRTCRTYDCRLFAAAGVFPENRPKVAAKAHCWQFELTSKGEKETFDAVRTAARFLVKHANMFPDGFVPSSASQHALLAIKVFEAFVHPPKDIQATVNDVLDFYELFESMRGESGRCKTSEHYPLHPHQS